MTASLYSAQWYRVAQLRPRLRPQVKVQRQHWRDQRWYLLSDAATGRQHRINDSAYQFIGRCDGQRTVHEVWNSLLEARCDDAPTQDEVLRLLGQLNENELLQSERASDASALTAAPQRASQGAPSPPAQSVFLPACRWPTRRHG